MRKWVLASLIVLGCSVCYGGDCAGGQCGRPVVSVLKKVEKLPQTVAEVSKCSARKVAKIVKVRPIRRLFCRG